MYNKINFIACIYFGVVLVSLPIYAQDVCIKRSPCSCVFSNGTGVDLSPSAKSSFLSAYIFELKNMPNGQQQFELSTYYYHPCFDVMPKVNATSINNTCGKPLSICRHVNTMDQINTTATYALDNGRYDFMGSSNVTDFSADGRSITYFNGPSSTTVLLVCAEADDSLHVYSLAEPDKVVLSYYSRSACLREIEEAGRSLGSSLLIIFFSLIIFYIVLGILTKKFLMGATGIEVIPNLAFWTELPNLVKDGWLFLLSGFKLPARDGAPVATPDPNSYDSI